MAESGINIVTTIVVADKSLLVSYDDAKTVVEDRAGKIDFRRKYLSGYLIEDWKEQLEEKKEPSPIDLAKLKEVLIKDFQEMHKAGVRLMPGTDVAVLLIYPGYSLHDELQLLVKYVSLTPMQAIISATRYPAEFFGMQKTLGTIEKGKSQTLSCSMRIRLTTSVTQIASPPLYLMEGIYRRKQGKRCWQTLKPRKLPNFYATSKNV